MQLPKSLPHQASETQCVASVHPQVDETVVITIEISEGFTFPSNYLGMTWDDYKYLIKLLRNRHQPTFYDIFFGDK